MSGLNTWCISVFCRIFDAWDLETTLKYHLYLWRVWTIWDPSFVISRRAISEKPLFSTNLPRGKEGWTPWLLAHVIIANDVDDLLLISIFVHLQSMWESVSWKTRNPQHYLCETEVGVSMVQLIGKCFCWELANSQTSWAQKRLPFLLPCFDKLWQNDPKLWLLSKSRNGLSSSPTTMTIHLLFSRHDITSVPLKSALGWIFSRAEKKSDSMMRLLQPSPTEWTACMRQKNKP